MTPTVDRCGVCGRPLTPACSHCQRPPDPAVIARGLDALQATSGQPSDDWEGCTT